MVANSAQPVLYEMKMRNARRPGKRGRVTHAEVTVAEGEADIDASRCQRTAVRACGEADEKRGEDPDIAEGNQCHDSGADEVELPRSDVGMLLGATKHNQAVATVQGGSVVP